MLYDRITLSGATRAQIERAVNEAHLPSLLVTLAYLTGDDDLLTDSVRTPREGISGHFDSTVAMAKAARAGDSSLAEIRSRAVDTIVTLQSAREVRPRERDDQEILTLVEFMTGRMDAEYVDLLRYELGLETDRELSWHARDLAPGRLFRVAIIGAGMSGLAAAHALAEAGIPYVVFERNADVGGTWFSNHYPGARLDTSNFTYTYTFAHRSPKDHFSKRDDVLRYFQEVADTHGIRPNIRFETQVTEAVLDEGAGTWRLSVRDRSGRDEHLEFNVVISAVGQLSEPHIPDFPGRRNFAGPSWHTAEWDHDVNLEGKRVSLIGTGASAFQVVPPVANVADHLTIYQRTPGWVLPTPDYTSPLAGGLRWLLENLPHYVRWYRFMQFWLNAEGVRHFATVDPHWEHPISVSADNEEARRRLADGIAEMFAGRPDLIEKLTPNYPPYAKRTLRDDGTWAAAMRRQNVSVVTEQISAITPAGIVTADDEQHNTDVIIYGTGFRASEFLSSLKVYGRNMELLDQFWAGDARAFYGMSIPRFPNLFCLYGPNTNLNTNGSLVMFSECAVGHIMACIKELLARNAQLAEVRQQVYDDYNAWVDDGCMSMAIGVASVHTWYKNKFGRVSQNWPFSTLTYWQGTRASVAKAYDFVSSPHSEE